MINICIDIGNTSLKLSVFDNNKLIHKELVKQINQLIVNDFCEKFPMAENAILSSVQKEIPEIENLLANRYRNFIKLSHSTPIPVINNYKTKETLGTDRLAAIVGGNNIFPDKYVLVIDAGTAITFDFINNKNEYTGGNISPGVYMRFKALHQFTEKLPLVDPSGEFPLLGDGTQQAILGGVMNGIIYEIDGYIDRLSKMYKDLITILTGGNAFLFDKKLKNTIFADQNLVLIGLNRIIEYNVKKI